MRVFRSNHCATLPLLNTENNDYVFSSQATFKFEGIKSRTKEQLQAMMYTEEMDQWLAEARREETHSEARLRAALLQEQQQQQQQQEQHQVRFQISSTSRLYPVT